MIPIKLVLKIFPQSQWSSQSYIFMIIYGNNQCGISRDHNLTIQIEIPSRSHTHTHTQKCPSSISAHLISSSTIYLASRPIRRVIYTTVRTRALDRRRIESTFRCSPLSPYIYISSESYNHNGLNSFVRCTHCTYIECDGVYELKSI